MAKFKCVAGVCVQDDVNGIFPNNTCGGRCAASGGGSTPPPPSANKFKCVAGNCVPDPNGPFNDPSCGGRCTPAPSASPTAPQPTPAASGTPPLTPSVSGRPPRPTPVPVCPYPSTFFNNRTESDAFRTWVRENFANYAASINLSATGPSNNCNYIRKAYANVMPDYALSLGEIYNKMKQDSSLTLDDFTKTNYEKLKKKEASNKLYATDEKVWETLIDEGELYSGGEIKRLKGGKAIYIVKYDSTGKKVRMSGTETSRIDDILDDMSEYSYYALFLPKNRDKKPMRGQVYKIEIKQNADGENYPALVLQNESYWTAFDAGYTFDDEELQESITESIIGDILHLIKEDNGDDDLIKTNKKPVDNKTTNQTTQTTQTTQQCIITKEQKVDLDAYITKNKGSVDPMTASASTVTNSVLLTPDPEKTKDIGQYDVKKMKELTYTDKTPAIRDIQNLSDACVVYQRKRIQGDRPDQVAALEEFLNGANINLSVNEPKFGGTSYPLILGDVIPETELAKFNLQDQAKLTVYVKDFKKVGRDKENCRMAIKQLNACLTGKKGGGIANCNDLATTVTYKINAYFCNVMVRGEGKFWTNLGLGKEWFNIKDNAAMAGSLYSVRNMIIDSPLRESNLMLNIKKTIMESIREKNSNNLTSLIKKNLLEQYRKNEK